MEIDDTHGRWEGLTEIDLARIESNNLAGYKPGNADVQMLIASLRAERARIADLEAAGQEMYLYAFGIMCGMRDHGPSIVPHLMDTDDNDGQRLREALEAWRRLRDGKEGR